MKSKNNMKLIMERWNRFSVQEEELQEGLFKNFALALTLLSGGSAYGAGSSSAASGDAAQQTQKADLVAVDEAMIQLASSIKSMHLLLSANSIGAVKMQGGPLSKCLEAFKTLSDNGMSTQDYEATLIDAVKNSINPQTHYDGLDQLNDLYNQVKEASDKFQPTPNK